MQVPDEQHVAPFHWRPPHWPYKLEQLPLEVVVVVVTAEVVLVFDVTEVVLLVAEDTTLVVVLPPPAVPVSLSVTTE